MSEICPCRSGKSYVSCCEPYHTGAQTAGSAEALMRSRYSAFALAQAQYLIDTWEGGSCPSLTDLQDDFQAQRVRGERWVNLKIISAQGGELDEQGEVSFIASLISEQQLILFSEVSQFIKRDGRWLYCAGESSLSRRKLHRNEPCPCESGKKWKRCCS